MRIKCSVDVHNRACAVSGVATTCKPTHAQISIGKKPGSNNDLFVMIATTKDLNGRKFNVKGNVLKVFTRFLQDGKATIQLKEPAFDIRISKVEPSQLKTFLFALKLAHEGGDLSKDQISTLAPASTKSVEKPLERLSINHRKDYPITTTFPSSLIFLFIHSCKLTRVDNRILKLRHLRSLDLCDNCIRLLPSDCGQLTQLRELRLDRNELTEFPASLCQSSWQTSLQVLSLKGNKLSGCALPIQFGQLQSLVDLSVDENELTALPPSVGNLRSLRRLSIAKNRLQILPASCLKWRLESLDVANNDFVTISVDNDAETNLDPRCFAQLNNSSKDSANINVDVPSLMEIAGNYILQKSIPFDAESIPRQLCWYLQYFAKRCFCGKFCFESAWRAQAPLDPNFVSQTCSNTSDGNGGRIPVLAFLCSRNCFAKFKRNPLAFSI